MANPNISQNQAPTTSPEAPVDGEYVELITGIGTTALVPRAEATSAMAEHGGYTNIRTRQPRTVYKPGMPLPLDVDRNPRDGDPQVPKLS